MPSKPPVRYNAGRLTIQVHEMTPYVVAQWSGRASQNGRSVALEAVADTLARDGEQVIHDLSRLVDVADPVVTVLARGITEAQRAGRAVTLVRCGEDLYRRLQRAGVLGSVTHAASLLGATQGLARDTGAGSMDLYLRSTPDMLSRLRRVISAVARQALLSEAAELQVKAAVTEAASNAIVHGSPEGQRNHVRVSFHVDGSVLIVEVRDQGPGFDETRVETPQPIEMRESGFGLFLMRRSMDRVEFYRDQSGMLVRMTKYLTAPA